MFKVVEPGGRGEDIVLKGNAFDILSVIEELQAAWSYYKTRSETTADGEFRDAFKGRMKDTEANIKELQAILDVHNVHIDGNIY